MASFVTLVFSEDGDFALVDMMIHPFLGEIGIIRGERNEPVNCFTGSNSINDEFLLPSGLSLTISDVNTVGFGFAPNRPDNRLAG
jgi:hypothetical protein